MSSKSNENNNNNNNEANLLELLLDSGRDDLWCLILVHLADDAVSLARFSTVNKACQRCVFGSFRYVFNTAAEFSTAAPNSIKGQQQEQKSRSVQQRNNDLVMPEPLLALWWKDYEEGNNRNNNDHAPDADEGNANKKLKTQHHFPHHGASTCNVATTAAAMEIPAATSTQYDRLEGLGYYQAVVRAGLLQKRRLITNDRYSKARVPHSALRMERMEQILQTGHFVRSKSLYEREFHTRMPEWIEQQQQNHTAMVKHDSVYEPDCEGGIVYCLAQFMVWENIFPDFHFQQVNLQEHCNILMYPGRKKYRECALYRTYMTVPSNLFHLSPEEIAEIWKTVPLIARFLVASQNETTVKW